MSGVIRESGCVATLCDPSPAAMNAAWRAALVARDLGCSLRLVHLAPGSRAQASHDALVSFTANLRTQLGVALESHVVQGDSLAAAGSLLQDIRLLVFNGQPATATRGAAIADQLARLARVNTCAALVVRRSATHAYRKIFMPLDLSAIPQALGVLANAIAPRANVELFHNLEQRSGIGLRVRDLEESVLRADRQGRLDGVRRELREEYARAIPAGPGIAVTAAFGRASEMVPARANASGADLVALTYRARGWLAARLVESVTRRVLGEARADILIAME